MFLGQNGILHSLTGMNMLKHILHRVRVADGTYANPFLADASAEHLHVFL